MRILTLLPDNAARRLRASLPSFFQVDATTVAQAERSLIDGETVAIVLDPCGLREEAFNGLIALAARAGCGMLFYSAMSQLAAERVVEAANQLTVEVAFYGGDDESRLLRRLMENIARPSVPALMLRGLADSLGRLPLRTRAASVALFGWRPLPNSLASFISGTGGHARTVQRWLEHAGLRGSGRLLCSARLARSWQPLLINGDSLHIVAARAGFHSVRTFESEFSRLIALSPRRAARQLTASEFARRLRAAVKR